MLDTCSYKYCYVRLCTARYTESKLSPSSLPQEKLSSSSKEGHSNKSSKKKHKRESVSLEESLIFYPVPSDTNDKKDDALLKQNKSPPLLKTIRSESPSTKHTREKKRKSRSTNEQPKHKKSKPNKSKGANSSSKPNDQSIVELEVTSTSSHTSKLPWCDGSITGVLRCDLCDFICLENHDLFEHNQEVHAAKDKAATLAPCEYDPAVDQNVQYKCTLCGLADYKLRRIRSHITNAHGGKLNSCERVTHKRAEIGFSLLVESVQVYKH